MNCATWLLVDYIPYTLYPIPIHRSPSSKKEEARRKKTRGGEALQQTQSPNRKKFHEKFIPYHAKISNIQNFTVGKSEAEKPDRR
jgi:hypothetical protein